MSSNFNKYLKNLSVISVAVLTLVGAGCAGSEPVAVNTVTPDTAVNEPVITPDTTTLMYKDGVYSADGKYASPGGDEVIGITLTLKDDLIMDATATMHVTNPKTEFFQERFSGSFKELIVGKKISEVELTVVSGSSLTPIGFKDALAQIEAQAKS